jgi:hypothetical protein
MNAHKNAPINSFSIFRQKEIYYIFRTHCLIFGLFSTKCCLFDIFICLFSSNTFLINHVLKFKYQPCRLKFNLSATSSGQLDICIPVSDDELAVSVFTVTDVYHCTDCYTIQIITICVKYHCILPDTHLAAKRSLTFQIFWIIVKGPF